MYEVRGANRVATRLHNRQPRECPRRTSATLRGQRRTRQVRLIDVKGNGETLLVGRGPLLGSREVQGFLAKGNAQGDSGALNKTRIMDQVRLERHMCLLKGLYIRGGLSLKLSMKGETVNKAKYSMGSKKEA
jgi:hypothetical protein